MRLSAST